MRGLMTAIAEAMEAQRRELRAEVAAVREDLVVLRAAMAVDDAPVRTVLDALAVERAALDALIEQAPHLTGGEVADRLAAMRSRLHAVDGSLQ